MKKIYMTLAAMLCGATAMAQTCTLSAAESEIAATAGETFDLELLVVQDQTEVNGMGCVLTFPEGIAPVYDEDEESYLLESPIAKKGHTVMLVQGKDDNGNLINSYALAVASTGSTFKTTSNTVAVVTCAVDKEIANGEYEINVTSASFNIGTQDVYPQEPFAIKVTVTGGVGINSINAEDSNAPIYNVAGQRVSKAQKGVFIQNGKKVAVK